MLSSTYIAGKPPDRKNIRMSGVFLSKKYLKHFNFNDKIS